jgi:acetyl-CoA carboxylase carboxyltransferase component
MLASAEDPKALKEQLASAIRPYIDVYRVAALATVDDVIDPRETRPLVAHYLKVTEGKSVSRPYRKREISPV